MGGVYWEGDFSRWKGMSKFLATGGETHPHTPSRENPMKVTFQEHILENLRLFSLHLCTTPHSQPTFTCSKMTTETQEKGVKYVQN